MATNADAMEEVGLQNAEGTKRYSMFVPTSLGIDSDAGTSAALFNYLERTFPVDERGTRKLILTQSLQVLADLGLLQTWTALAKGSGVTIGKHTHFDKLSQAAYSREVGDDVLGTLGAVAPKHLSAREKVRFMEIGVASLPMDTDSRAPTPELETETLPIIKRLRTSRRSSTPCRSSSASPLPRTSSASPIPRTSSASPVPRTSSASPLPLSSASPIPSTSTATPMSMTEDHAREEEDADDLPGTDSDKRLYWSHEAVLLLIDLRQKLQHLFSSSTVSMKQAWKAVADHMNEKGFFFTGSECDKKFRSMKSSFSSSPRAPAPVPRENVELPVDSYERKLNIICSNKEMVGRIMALLFNTELARQFNWTGQGTSNKKVMKSLRLTAAKKEATRKKATEAEVESAISTWLKNSMDRDGGRKKRSEKKTEREAEMARKLARTRVILDSDSDTE